ncbi:MAG: Uma2 family endonuclease [Pirellulaceae bacterium]
MSLASPISTIEYPESDGKPMGETDLHRAWMHRVYELLRRRHADQRVYVGCNLLVYYAEGSPFEFCVPDVFLTLDCDPGPRRVFKIWEEQRAPDVVFEITSRSTRREDEVFKPQSYAKIGVKEYFLYDPTADYLKPPLKGFRLAGDHREPILPDAQGELACQVLGLRLRLDARELVLTDAATGQPLLTDAEAAEAQAEAADARAEAAEAEVRRLRDELAKLRRPDQE